MKKTYLAPKSETLMAILREVCGGTNPTINPGGIDLVSGGTPQGGGNPAPRHSL